MKKSFWNDLLYEKTDADRKKETQEKTSATFPNQKASPSFPSQGTPSTAEFPQSTPMTSNTPTECDPHMEAIGQMYEKGFNEMNQDGVDFFEFFQAVISAGAVNAQGYQMAFNIVKGMAKTISKESLLQQSNSYIEELKKVHASYDKQGKNAKNELLATKATEAKKLQDEVSGLKIQLEAIKTQITSKENELSQIDAKYQPRISELDCKIMANDHASGKILGSITNVVNGINQYL